MTKHSRYRQNWEEDGSRRAQLIWTLCVAIAVAASALYRVGSPTSGAMTQVVTASEVPRAGGLLKLTDRGHADTENLPPGVERVPASESTSHAQLIPHHASAHLPD